MCLSMQISSKMVSTLARVTLVSPAEHAALSWGKYAPPPSTANWGTSSHGEVGEAAIEISQRVLFKGIAF